MECILRTSQWMGVETRDVLSGSFCLRQMHGREKNQKHRFFHQSTSVDLRAFIDNKTKFTSQWLRNSLPPTAHLLMAPFHCLGFYPARKKNITHQCSAQGVHLVCAIFRLKNTKMDSCLHMEACLPYIRTVQEYFLLFVLSLMSQVPAIWTKWSICGKLPQVSPSLLWRDATQSLLKHSERYKTTHKISGLPSPHLACT